MDEQWLEQLREKMADYKRPAPEVSWEAIDDLLSPRKARVLWPRHIAAAALLLLSAGLSYWLLFDSSVEQPQAMRPVSDELSLPSSSAMEEPIHVVRADIPKPTPRVRKPADTAELADTATLLTSVDSPSTPPEVESVAAADEQEPAVTQPVRIGVPTEFHQRQIPSSHLMAKLYLSNVVNDSRSTGLMDGYITKDDADKDDILEVQSLQSTQYVHHHQPLRVGLSVCYPLSDRWSVESGLTYTRLVSDITVIDAKTITTVQRLHYLGLPLNVCYQLWTIHRFGLYGFAGGTVEKALNTTHWQFSINGAAGLEYQLTNHLGLYAEPGVAYYLPNNSSLPTLYQDRPFNITLTLGLRFNLKP